MGQTQAGVRKVLSDAGHDLRFFSWVLASIRGRGWQDHSASIALRRLLPGAPGTVGVRSESAGREASRTLRKTPGPGGNAPGRQVCVRADSACLHKVLEELFGGSPSGRILRCIERIELDPASAVHEKRTPDVIVVAAVEQTGGVGAP
jgi:hypothetical protein